MSMILPPLSLSRVDEFHSFHSTLQSNIQVISKSQLGLTPFATRARGTGPTRGTGEPFIAARVGREPSPFAVAAPLQGMGKTKCDVMSEYIISV